MNILAIIPARMASTRFPNKPLVDIGGKTMIRRVYEQAQKSNLLKRIIVATDHEDIYKEVQSFNGDVVMTKKEHPNGTSRCAEVAATLSESYDIIINIQGDEPFFEPDSLKNLIACFESKKTQLASLCKKIEDVRELDSPSVVKVVKSRSNKALYFSRTAIPFTYPTDSHSFYYKHIGIYAYTPQVLRQIVQLEQTVLEQAEKLEQLRWLEHDYEIFLGETKHDSNSVDTPEDLKRLKKQFNISAS